MIIVYTGEGKGKTCACVGQAVRALGNGMTVGFGQFIKKDDIAGEQRQLREWLGERFRAGGIGFCQQGEDKARHRASARALLDWARSLRPDMLILDEALYALKYGLLSGDEILPLLVSANQARRHVVLSGRKSREAEAVLEMADIITEMRNIRHDAAKGAPARPGIEF